MSTIPSFANASGNSYQNNNGNLPYNTNPNNNYPITCVLSSFITSFAGASAVTGVDGGIVSGTALNASPVTPALLNTLLSNYPTPTTTPKAYINWILFDEQFRPVTSSSCSYYIPVGAADAVNNQTGTATITKNGYLYVYCSVKATRMCSLIIYR